MGARLGRWDIQGDPPMGSPTNACIGLFVLWWGWLAFNASSTFTAFGLKQGFTSVFPVVISFLGFSLAQEFRERGVF